MYNETYLIVEMDGSHDLTRSNRDRQGKIIKSPRESGSMREKSAHSATFSPNKTEVCLDEKRSYYRFEDNSVVNRG